jgi:hypothetical protein
VVLLLVCRETFLAPQLPPQISAAARERWQGLYTFGAGGGDAEEDDEPDDDGSELTRPLLSDLTLVLANAESFRAQMEDDPSTPVARDCCTKRCLHGLILTQKDFVSSIYQPLRKLREQLNQGTKNTKVSCSAQLVETLIDSGLHPSSGVASHGGAITEAAFSPPC